MGEDRQVATYVGTIAHGAKPSDLPVVQTNVFDLAANRSTATKLGIPVSPTLSAQVTVWLAVTPPPRSAAGKG
jgi:ABC-type uncharacterized transport system substrate-binding protein